MSVKDMVLEGLERCRLHDGSVCKNCNYSHTECVEGLCADALKLIEQQQAESDRLKAELAKVLLCKECKYFQEGIDINGEPFTRCNCGKKQPMTWGASVKPDWFCGHAEAKDGEQE